MRKLALVMILGVLLSAGGTAAPALAGCSNSEFINSCVTGGGVTIGGGGSSTPPSSPPPPPNSGPAPGASDLPPEPEPEHCLVRECFTVIDLTDDDAVAALGPITWSDIEHFEPIVEAHHMEPNGWIVVGLPTNFYATGGPHVEHGEVLGLAASVRFSPQRWTWNYGDGHALTTETPGASWESQGLDEFDETPTSHVFHERGRHTITLSVEYSAEYRFAGGAWIPLDGTISVQSDPIAATAVSASTVLVDKNCDENPRGPGC